MTGNFRCRQSPSSLSSFFSHMKAKHWSLIFRSGMMNCRKLLKGTQTSVSLLTTALTAGKQKGLLSLFSSCLKFWNFRFGVGQNLYIYKQTLAIPETDWEKAVTDWYEEVTLFSRKHVEPFKFSSPTGHYTALVWADTDKVGCGATSFKNGRWFSTLYTCNYGPNGNYINGQMYKQSRSCSECGVGEICSVDYPGLCSKNNNIIGKI